MGFAKIGKEANISLVRTERPKIVQAAIDKKNEAANYKPNPSRKKEEEAVVDHLTNRKKHLGRLDQFKPLFVSCLDIFSKNPFLKLKSLLALTKCATKTSSSKTSQGST